MLMLLCPLLSALATPSFSLADLRSQITTIVVGFILLVVGIGAAESTNAKEEEFGLSRCKQFLGSRSDLSPLVVADALLSEIARWSSRSSGRLQQDDMTLIVMILNVEFS